MLLSILALIATVVVAMIGAIQGICRAAQTLVALVLAAAVAFGLFSPVTDAVFPASGDARSTWYYAGDAFCLWALLCLGFFGLRVAAGRLLPVAADFPRWVDRAGAAVLGLVTGYLAVGLCLVIGQMLPVAPSFLGYEPFTYVRGTSEDDPERVEPGDRLWLGWDRAALRLFGYVTSRALGSAQAPLFGRYTDVYDPAEPGGEVRAVADADDFLYYHWYRRWEAIRWRTGATLGPLPEVPISSSGGRGVVLGRNHSGAIYGMDLRIFSVQRAGEIPQFPKEGPGEGNDFLLVVLRFQPVAEVPRIIDSAQFHLIDSMGGRVGGAPLIFGPALVAEPENEAVVGSSAAATAPRNLRFGFPERGRRGQYLMDGTTFTFASRRQYENRTLIFTIPKTVKVDDVRLFLAPTMPDVAEPKPPAKPAPGPAPPAAAAPAAK